jgi:hypothetical protein
MRILLPIMPDTASSLDRVMKFPNLGLCSLAARRSRFFGDFPAFRGKMLPNNLALFAGARNRLFHSTHTL